MQMSDTRGKLVAAQIYEVNKKGKKKDGGLTVSCMFNPFEYSVSKSNNFEESSKNQSDVPHVEFKKAGAQTLKLNLIFDSYEQGTDVSEVTNELWKFMMTKTQEASSKNEKVEPPQVAFEWGVFNFVSYITNMTQKFTLFKNDGTPVRANVDVTFTQYNDVDDYDRQNPTSGGGPIERVWQVVAGQRLDTISAEVYQDAGKWRLIAEHNHLRDPLALRPGMQLRIPSV
jgi:hypothetical protein